MYLKQHKQIYEYIEGSEKNSVVAKLFELSRLEYLRHGYNYYISFTFCQRGIAYFFNLHVL